MMSGEQADPQVLDELSAEERGRDRWKQRLLAALPYINTAAVLVLTSICADALVTAWQTSDWQHFYWNTSGPISLLFALSQYPRLWPDTPTKVVAPGANRKSGSTSEPLPDYAVSPAQPQPSPLERLTETPASIIRLAYSMRSRPDVWKRWKRTMLYGPVIVVLLLYASAWGLRWVQHGGNWGLEQIQLAFDDGLPDRIHAETPLYSDILAAEDGQWPVHPATVHDAAYGYADGEYEISDGSGRAMLKRTYGDVAVEVTARLDFTGPFGRIFDDLGEMGLVVRASSNPDSLITFTFGVFGDWSLMRYRGSGAGTGHWQVLEHGERPGLRTSGDPDRLLVLVRGTEYICFVNDKPVAHVYDDSPAAGQVGLWLQQKTPDDAATVGYYSHFAVYPAV